MTLRRIMLLLNLVGMFWALTYPRYVSWFLWWSVSSVCFAVLLARGNQP